MAINVSKVCITQVCIIYSFGVPLVNVSVTRSQSSMWKHAAENCKETFFLFDSKWRRHKQFISFEGWQRQREKKGLFRHPEKATHEELGFSYAVLGWLIFVPLLSPVYLLYGHRPIIGLLSIWYSCIWSFLQPWFWRLMPCWWSILHMKHILSQVIIFLEKQTKDRFGSLYFSLRWWTGHKRDNWLPKVKKEVCV